MNQSKVHFYNLDILRFLAAAMIVCSHAYEAWIVWFGFPSLLQNTAPQDPNLLGIWSKTFSANLTLAVDLFFLISGFLITYLLLKEKKKTNTISILKFYIRRGLRIWPLYFLIIACAPFIILYRGGDSPDYLYNILFLNNFHAITTQQWTYPFSHLWSICVEEHFYLMWPLVILFIPNKKLPTAFVMLIVLSIAFRSYVAYTGLGYYYLYLHTLSRIDVMICGGLIAYIHFMRPISVSINRTIRILLYIVFVFILLIEPFNLWDTVFSAALKKYWYTSVMAFAVVNYLFNETAFLNFKKKNVLHYLGKISYGIYMFGNVVLPFAIDIQLKLTGTKFHNVFVFMFISSALTIGLAVLSYELFEKYFLKLKTRFEIVKTSR